MRLLISIAVVTAALVLGAEPVYPQSQADGRSCSPWDEEDPTVGATTKAAAQAASTAPDSRACNPWQEAESASATPRTVRKDQSPTIAPSRSRHSSGLVDEPTIPWRNNNPGNLKPRRKGPWPGEVGRDRRGHIVFATLEDGVAAWMDCVLVRYRQGGFRTPSKTVARYTTVEDDRSGYVATIRRFTGVRDHQDLGLIQAGQVNQPRLFALARAMFRYEHGHDGIGNAVLEAALARLTAPVVVAGQFETITD